MGIFDKAKDLAAAHPDVVDSGIDKTADFADAKTENKYAEQIEQGSEQAKKHVADFLQRPEQ